MLRKSNKHNWFVPIAFLWMLYCLFIYFFNITRTSGVCKLSSFCLGIENISWQIVANQSHQYYTDAFLESIGVGPSKSGVPGPILLILAGLLFLYTANLFYDRFVEKKKQLELNLTPFSIFLILSAIFFLIYNRWITFFGLEEPIRYQSIFIKYPIFTGELLAMILLPLSLGRRLLHIIFPKEEEKSKLQELLFSLGFGLIAIMLVLFFLGLLKILVLKFVLIMLGVLLLISIKSLIYWIINFFTYKINFGAKYFEASVFLAVLLLLAVAQNILDLIRPLPIGFDDLNVYMNNPHMMAAKGALISGAMSYYWELFTSLGFIIFKNVTAAMMISFISVIGCVLSLLYLILFYCKKRGFDPKTSRFYSLLIAAFFITLPAVVFHTAKDIKVDLAGLFFTLLSLALFWQWRDKYLESKIQANISKNRLPRSKATSLAMTVNNYKRVARNDSEWLQASSYLYAAAFLAGFAAAIKYTNLIFVFVLFIYFILIIRRKKEVFVLKKSLMLPILFIFFVLLPILPISVRNIVQTRSFSVADIRFGKRTSQEIKIDPPFNEGEGIVPDFNTYMVKVASGDREEAGRYIGYERGIKKYLMLPFRITKNVFSTSLYVDISFLFLALTPLAVYAFVLSKRLPRSKATSLAMTVNNYKRIARNDSEQFLTNQIFEEAIILGAIYWTLWTFLANGIIWYGFGGFIFLFFAIIEAHNYIKNQKNRLLYTFTNTLIIVWFICAVFLRMANLPKYNIGLDPGGVRYARGETTPEENLKGKFGYLNALDEINHDIAEHPENPPKVYRVGTFYKYLISRNDETVIDDQMLDVFAYCYQDRDDNKLIERFKKSGIKYMIIDRGMRNVDRTPEQSYAKKYDQFENLIRKNASKNFGIMSDSLDEKIFILRIY